MIEITMRAVYVDWDYTKVGYLKSELDAAGIPCFIQNEYAHNSIATFSPVAFWPTLCVHDDKDYLKALELVREFNHPRGKRGPDVKCPHCGEMVPANFEVCWNCQCPMPTDKN